MEHPHARLDLGGLAGSTADSFNSFKSGRSTAALPVGAGHPQQRVSSPATILHTIPVLIYICGLVTWMPKIAIIIRCWGWVRVMELECLAMAVGSHAGACEQWFFLRGVVKPGP